MKKYTETRHLDETALRSICVEWNWYTLGDNDEYAALFSRLHDEEGNLVNMTTERLAEIAADIMEHSEPEPDLTIPTVMFMLCRKCNTYFTEA